MPAGFKSFDVVGNRDKAVAIVEMPAHAKGKKQRALELMKAHKNVRSVLQKSSPRRGVFRTRRLRLLAGDRNTEVEHKEHGLRILLDPRKVYFSPREGTERMRVASLVGNGETVMVFFAGAGPFALAIAKEANPDKVIGIEINPVAVRYFRKNVALNKLRNVAVVKGDVRTEAKRFYNSCSRIVMPLPERAMEYLDEAIRCIRPPGVIHLYCFAAEPGDVVKRIAAHNVQVVRSQKVLPYSPRMSKWRIDLAVG